MREATGHVEYLWWHRRGAAGRPDDAGLVAPWLLGRHSLGPGEAHEQILDWYGRGLYRWALRPLLALMRTAPACVSEFRSRDAGERQVLVARSYRQAASEGELSYLALVHGLGPVRACAIARELRLRGARWYERLEDWPDP